MNLRVRSCDGSWLSTRDEIRWQPIHYARLDEFWRNEQKYDCLEQQGHIGTVDWQVLSPHRAPDRPGDQRECSDGGRCQHAAAAGNP